MKNFALMGVGGYIAPRHLKAISDTGNRLIAALDPHDLVGLLDQYGLDVSFFTEAERFDRHLEKLRRVSDEERVHYVSVCSPNYLHDAHCRMALRAQADVICEKPLVINPWNLDALEDIEHETGRRINTVLQLRLHPAMIALRDKLQAEVGSQQHDVCLTYITARGRWYQHSWKGDVNKSGGLAVNIGIHLFDLMLWLFGPFGECRVYADSPTRMAGFLEFERARVKWFLSVDSQDLPFETGAGHPSSYRVIQIDGEEIEFTQGFTDLHTRVYERALAGQGFGIEDVRPATELTYAIRQTGVCEIDEMAHPLLRR